MFIGAWQTAPTKNNNCQQIGNVEQILISAMKRITNIHQQYIYASHNYVKSEKQEYIQKNNINVKLQNTRQPIDTGNKSAVSVGVWMELLWRQSEIIVVGGQGGMRREDHKAELE